MKDCGLYWAVSEGDPAPPSVKTPMYATIKRGNIVQRIAHGVVDDFGGYGFYTPMNRDEIKWWDKFGSVEMNS